MPGAKRTRSLACKMKKAHELVTTGQPNDPAFPARLVLTVSFVLFLVIGLSCHHHRRDAKHHRPLDASVEASEPHDFAVREPRARLKAQPSSIASRAQRP